MSTSRSITRATSTPIDPIVPGEHLSKLKTITRLFDNYSDVTGAVRELEALGIPHSDISIVANNVHGEHGGVEHDGVNDQGDVSRGNSTGALLGGAGGLPAGLGLLAIPASARSWQLAGSRLRL